VQIADTAPGRDWLGWQAVTCLEDGLRCLL
jgi:hypothetical protein